MTMMIPCWMLEIILSWAVGFLEFYGASFPAEVFDGTNSASNSRC